jgi:hypothetical protein
LRSKRVASLIKKLSVSMKPKGLGLFFYQVRDYKHIKTQLLLLSLLYGEVNSFSYYHINIPVFRKFPSQCLKCWSVSATSFRTI